MKRVRRCACVAVLCLVATPLAAVGADDANSPPPEVRTLAREIFAQLIAIDTTHEKGSTPAAEAMAARLLDAGFPPADVQVIGPRPGKRNLVARLRGKGRARPILFLSHLDVVEAKREDWSYDPFVLTEEGGYFYGRGTGDIKGECTTLITTLLRFRKEGYVPEGDLIVALTEDEETRSDANGANWLLENARELIDAAFVINTDAAGGQIENGVHVRFPVQTSEKGYVSYQLEVTNPGGHSSMPRRDNAIYTLARALDRLSAFEFPVRFNDTTQAYVRAMADRVEEPARSDLLAAIATPPDPAAIARLGAEPIYNSMMRTTCVATVLEAGDAENALPQRARATMQCRLLPGDAIEEVRAKLAEVAGDPAVTVSVLNDPIVAPASPVSPEVMGAVERVAGRTWPGVAVLPVMDVWSTDGVYFRRAGLPVYGVSGIFFDIDDVRSHGRDERIYVEAFYEGVEFMYRFMKELSGRRG
jgi:acetylornithine deacetylase/succinyl-diaminopimelate desuccinylase-like protein